MSLCSSVISALSSSVVKSPPVTAEEYLGIIRYQAGNLTHLIDQLLKSMTNGQQVSSIKQERVSLTNIVQQCLHQYQPQLQSNSAILTVDLDAEVFVNGDEAHLGNVVANLLDNAIKYSEQPPVIAIRLNDNKSEAALQVGNVGPAIPVEYQNKIFERFFRVPAGNTHNVKGYGLGLSYVKEILRQHGGHIALRCENGQNIFTICLPLA